MEQVRLFMAIALSFTVFLVWEIMFTKEVPPPDQQQPVQEEKPSRVEPAKPDQRLIGKPIIVEPLAPVKQALKTIKIENNMFSAAFTTKGADLKDLILKQYRETSAKDSALKTMVSEKTFEGIQIGLASMGQAVFKTTAKTDKIYQTGELSFNYQTKTGIRIEKKYHFTPDNYLISLSIILHNQSEQKFEDQLSLSIIKPGEAHKQSETHIYGFTGPLCLLDDKLELIKTDKIKDEQTFTGKIKWMAFEDRYFINAIIPQQEVKAKVRIKMVQDQLIISDYLISTGILPPGTSKSFQFNLFCGPKSMPILTAMQNDLDRSLDFGWFDFLAKPCLWLMNIIYQYLPNYGVAIIIMTILIKMILWPLGNKGYKSMNEMKKLQPLMVNIREKHKDDKQRMNLEMMNLYKTYKVNPVGGCLPLLLQIPIFIALYRMLYEAIELRHAPFFGWITDLSAPDRLFRFGFSIPFMQPPYGIPILTIIMGATMFLQQKMAPPPGDPTQAKMMMLMPLVMTVIFINFSSGLVLYWLISNILSIAQQYYVSKRNT